jgi:ABC-type multidrug transport system ATPase subunit
VSADFDMFPYLSLEDNIHFFLEFYGVMPNPAAMHRLLDRYRLADVRSTTARVASRGMLRKTQIITALLQSPTLLLADEPFDGLDEAAQATLTDDLVTYTRGGGIALVVLHDQQRMKTIANVHVAL